MDADPTTLRYPWIRSELIVELAELAVRDPRQLWARAGGRGLASGIDGVFHFFFDDHDFSDEDIGWSLLNTAEVAAVADLKSALDRLLGMLGDVGDDAFVQHPAWADVTLAATRARKIIQST